MGGRRLRAGLALAGVAPFTLVGANVPVSSDALLRGNGQQAEPSLATDPLDSGRLVAGAQEGRLATGGARANGVYASADGGGSWSQALVPGLTRAGGGRFQRATDPSVAFGADGTAVYSSLVLDVARGRPTSTAIVVNRSRDGGRSWSAPVTVARSVPAAPLDEPWLAAGAGGRLYVAYSREDATVMPPTQRMFVARSDDGGATWRRSVLASGATHFVAGKRLVVSPDGTVALLYVRAVLRSARDQLRLATSRDGGATWRSRVVAARRYRFVPGLRSGPGIALAADASTGAVHAAWTDGHRVLAARVPGGRPVRVAPVGAGETQFTPSVAAAGGAVHVLFYDRLRGGRYSVRYAQSLDGGATFRAPLRVSPPFGLTRAARTTDGRFLGDYAAIAATESFAQALWVDSRGATNDVFTARIGPVLADPGGAPRSRGRDW